MNSSHLRARSARFRVGMSVMAVAAALSPTLVDAQSIGRSIGRSSDRASMPVELTMAEAVRRAIAHSATVAVAERQHSAAESRVKQARAALLPTVVATASRSTSTRNSAEFGFVVRDAAGQPLLNPLGDVLGPIRAVDVRVAFEQRVLDPAAIARVRVARAAKSVADAETGVAASDAATAAALTFISVLRTDAYLAAMKEDSAMAASLADDAARRHAAGLAIALEVTRADAQRVNAGAALVSARVERARAELALKWAIGLTADVPTILADSLIAYGRPVRAHEDSHPDELGIALASALRNRDDVRSAAARVTAAQRVRSALRAEYLPTMSIVADRGVLGTTRRRLLPTYTWGVQLSVPVFDSFRRVHRLDEQQAQLETLAIMQRDLAERVELEMRDARLVSMKARAALEVASDRLRLAVQELEQAQERCKAGLAGNADVIMAQLTLSAARVQRVERLAEVASAHVMEQRAGGETRVTRH